MSKLTTWDILKSPVVTEKSAKDRGVGHAIKQVFSSLLLGVILSLVLLAVGYGLKHPQWKDAGWQSLIAHGLAALSANILKHVIGRPRPKFMHAGNLEFSPVSGSGWDSFPSGHAAAAFAVATVLARLDLGLEQQAQPRPDAHLRRGDEEAAKRRLLYTLDRLGLPYTQVEPKLTFDFKADVSKVIRFQQPRLLIQVNTGAEVQKAGVLPEDMGR